MVKRHRKSVKKFNPYYDPILTSLILLLGESWRKWKAGFIKLEGYESIVVTIILIIISSAVITVKMRTSPHTHKPFLM